MLKLSKNAGIEIICNVTEGNFEICLFSEKHFFAKWDFWDKKCVSPNYCKNSRGTWKRKNADHIYVLDKGTIVEAGTYEELMEKDGVFTSLAKRQIA